MEEDVDEAVSIDELVKAEDVVRPDDEVGVASDKEDDKKNEEEVDEEEVDEEEVDEEEVDSKNADVVDVAVVEVDVAGAEVLELEEMDVEVVVAWAEVMLGSSSRMLDVVESRDKVDALVVTEADQDEDEEFVELVEAQEVVEEKIAEGSGRDMTMLNVEEGKKGIALLTFAEVFEDEFLVLEDEALVVLDDFVAEDFVMLIFDDADVVFVTSVFVCTLDEDFDFITEEVLLMLVVLFISVTFGTLILELVVAAGVVDINCAPQTPLFC